MNKFFSKHSAKLKTTALILMLLIPFLLYAAALHGSAFQVKLFPGTYGSQYAVRHERRLDILLLDKLEELATDH